MSDGLNGQLPSGFPEALSCRPGCGWPARWGPFIFSGGKFRAKKKRNARIEEVLKEVGLSDKKTCMPHELSGGEQQRIAIARALLNTPKLIIADEPTGNLDPETAAAIIQLLREVSQTGTAVVMSTHNMPLLDRYPGIVYRCVDGSVNEVTDEFRQFGEL